MVSCKLFTTLRYCLVVLSESSMATQFYVVEFPSEDEKINEEGHILSQQTKLKKKTEPLKFCGVSLMNLRVTLMRYTTKQHASSKVRRRNAVISLISLRKIESGWKLVTKGE